MIVIPFAASAKKTSGEGGNIAALITDFAADTLTLDMVEYVTDDDTERNLKTYDPIPGMPFFFEIEDGIIRSVTEKPFA